MAFPCIAEAGQIGSASGSRLFAQVALVHIIAMQVIVVVEFVVDVRSALINIYWCSSRTKKSRLAAGSAIGMRDKIHQGNRRWISSGGDVISLRITPHARA